MRILLAFIVILNLLYMGWEYINPVSVGNTVKPLSADLKKLELLHEPKVLEPPVAEVSAIENESKNKVQESVEPQPVVGSVSCYTLGPFKDESIMQQLRESIAEYVSDISVRKRQESEKHRYWVYMPALSDRKQAKLMAKNLRQKGINDFYIVLSGVAKNGISLGHFRNPKHANRRMKKVADLGFDVEIKVIYRDYDIYWLDYQVESANGEEAFSVDEYASDGVSQLVRDCKA
ncbi:hypothetical protein MNBD_GAMMA08-516 [hydrothermal vent metagenome]|uniref:SPOR domain-containing protein n=1 Tax=hydrothermal vent metagenome TaxID=652676 RepID=A0A3B0XI20_9ZZZZ